MTTYGLLASGMAVLSLFMGIFQSPAWLIGGTLSTYLVWQLLSKPIQEKNFKKIKKGRVLNIKANGTFLGYKHQPLYDAEIAYLDRVKKLKNLVPNSIHDVVPEDILKI